MSPRELAREALALHAEHMADPAAAELYVMPRSIPQANRLIELAHQVPDLAQALLAALDERDELRLILAAELGQPEGAPSEGWRWTGAIWFHPRTLMVVQPEGRLWRINADQGDMRLYPREPLPARTAMIAADKAAP